jgi:hypothetical protein
MHTCDVLHHRLFKHDAATGFYYYTETELTLSCTFRACWEAHGRLVVRGFPTTDPFEEKHPDDGTLYMWPLLGRNRFELSPYAGKAMSNAREGHVRGDWHTTAHPQRGGLPGPATPD